MHIVPKNLDVIEMAFAFDREFRQLLRNCWDSRTYPSEDQMDKLLRLLTDLCVFVAKLKEVVTYETRGD